MSSRRQSGSAGALPWSIRLLIASELARSRFWMPEVRRFAIRRGRIADDPIVRLGHPDCSLV